MQKIRTSYYLYSTAFYNIVLCGDVEIDLVYTTIQNVVLSKRVERNRKRFECNSCLSPSQLSCTTTQKKQYTFYNPRATYSWTCTHFTLSTLLFFHSRDTNLDEINVTSIQPKKDSHVELIQRHRNSTLIAYTNT